MWFNPIMEWLIKSPFHGVISGSTMIIYYTGCKSGKAYHTPVSYQRVGNELFTISSKDRTWWKNFREACEIKILLKGKLIEANAQVYEYEAVVGEGLKQLIKINPGTAKMLKIDLSETGQPKPESLRMAANKHVLVKMILK